MIKSTQPETLTLTVPLASESEVSYLPISCQANGLTLIKYDLPKDISSNSIEESHDHPDQLTLMIGGLAGNSKEGSNSKTIEKFEFTKDLLNLIIYQSLHQFTFDQTQNISLNRKIKTLSSSKHPKSYLVLSVPFFNRSGTVCLNSPKELKLLLWVQRPGINTLEKLHGKQTAIALDNLYK